MDRTTFLELLRDPEVKEAFRSILREDATPPIEFMTPQQYADRHGVSLSTVQRWVNNGLTSYKADKIRRIPVAEGDAWLLRGGATALPKRRTKRPQ